MYKKSTYSKLQQTISYALIFSILFLNTFQIPFFDKTQADAATDMELVSIIIHEDVYSSIQSKIKRYAEDIQAKLNNTKVLIYKVPSDITPQKIAALNEKLYFEGDGNTTSRLVGTILVGDIPLPVIHNDEKTFLSIYPYVDFKEKNFIYDNSLGFYKQTSESISDYNPEIWHSVIAPNTGDSNQDKIKLNEFFDKDHNFYTKSGVFATSFKEPFVFYYDGKRDDETSDKNMWKGYQLWIQNIEDITYNRYNKYLATKLSNLFFGNTNEDMKQTLESVGASNPAILEYIKGNMGSSSPDMKATPDAMTKKIIDAVTKRFYQVFNDKHLGDILKYVYNAGRYGESKDVRVDTAITLISKRDNVMRRLLKDTNTSLEGVIDDVIKKGLSRDIAAPSKVEEDRHIRYKNNYWETCTSSTTDPDTGEVTSSNYNCNPYNKCDGFDETNHGENSYWHDYRYHEFEENNYVGVLENYFYGVKGNDLTGANQCSIYRGTQRTEDNKSVLVEASRAYNLDKTKINADIGLLSRSPNESTCLYPYPPKTQSFWGGHSVLNYDLNNIGSGSTDFNKLLDADFRRAVLPLYDAAGGKEVGYNWNTDIQDTKIDVSGKSIHTINPLDCNNFNWIYTTPNDLTQPQGRCDSKYSLNTPSRVSARGELSYETGSTYEDLYLNNDRGKVYFSTLEAGRDLHDRYLYLDGKRVATDKTYLIEDYDNACKNDWQYVVWSKYYFNRIPSIVYHKSPTDEEYGEQLKVIGTPSLPSDRDRYVDFVSAKGRYEKYEYPNLFRVGLEMDKDISYNGAKVKLKQYLDKKSDELNEIIKNNNPSSLSSTQKEIYETLKTGNYPEANIDFWDVLSKDPKIIDEVIRNVLWRNLDSADLKYKYIFEHYLDIDGNEPSINTAHKSDYEIVYLGQKGTAQSMYMRVDPEKKKQDPPSDITNIMSSVDKYKSANSASNISSTSNTSSDNGDFKCGPPDGVPIFQWISAVMCWLGTLTPPISISTGKCSSTTLGVSGDASGFDTSFGGDLPQETNPIYNEDKNKNGIPDGAELINNGVIDILSDKKFYSYNNSVKIKANLISSEGKLIAVDNTSKVQFEITKAYSVNGDKRELIFETGSNSDLSSPGNLYPYVNFTPTRVKVSKGVANYSFSVNRNDADIYIRATIETKDKNQKVAVFNISDEYVIKVRGTTLEGNAMIGSSYRSSMEAGEVKSLDFSIKTYDKDNKEIKTNYPITFKVSGSEGDIGEEIKLYKSTFEFDSPILKKAGTYKFTFTDDLGFQDTSTFTVNPGKLSSIKLVPSSTQFLKNNEAEVFMELLDKYGNRAKGDLYNITGDISGSGLFGLNAEKQIKKAILEGYMNFKIQSDGNYGKINLRFSADDTGIKSDNLELEVISDAKIKVNIDDPSNIVVGGEKHKINLELQRGTSGEILDKFNGVVYFDINELNGVISPNFAQIKNGKMVGEIYFIPNYLAGKNLKIDTSVPGINVVEGNTFTLLPEKPMYIGLINSKKQLEAKEGISTDIKATLYDRYGNIAFNDSSHSVNLEILDTYKKTVKFSGNKQKESVSLINGVAETKAFATDIPGAAYIIARVTSPLSTNSYTVKDSSGKEITISGISENIVPFDSYYVFDGDKVKNLDYNGLYTVLQGSNYGDITQKGYLGGEIVFNKSGRSLAVTSLLNNPYSREMAFGFTPGGKFVFSNDSSNQSFSLQSEFITSAQGTSINLYDSIYKELIARAWLNFGSDTSLVDCPSDDNEDVSACKIPTDKSFILLKGIGENFKTVKEGDKIKLTLNNFDVFSITNKGVISKDPGVSFEFDENAIGNMLGVKIILNKENIGYLSIKFKTDNIDIYNTSEFPNILASHKNQIVLEHISSDYYYDSDYLGVSSHGAKGISFYKLNDSDESVDKRLVSGTDKIGYENYIDEAGIGWRGNNRSLLEFASSNTLGDSTRFYTTFSMINLGDPVISLDKIKPEGQDFDKTLGKKVAEEKSSKIEYYNKMDFNGDGNPDIVLFYDNGFVDILANYNGDYKDYGHAVYIPDSGNGRKGVGDFSRDEHDDLVFIDNKGKLGFIDNTDSKFKRQTPIIQDIATGNEVEIEGYVLQMESIDMDLDGYTDIVMLTDNGELLILYGGPKNSDGTQVFKKKTLDKTLGLTLKTQNLKTGGAVYYTGLPQIGDPQDQTKFLLDSQKLIDEYNANGSSSSPTGSSDETFNTMLDKLIYYQEKYEDTSFTGTTEVSIQERRDSILSAIGTDENGNSNVDMANEIVNNLNDLTILNGSGMTQIDSIKKLGTEKTRTFLRSQFAEANGLIINKTYKDLNGGFLKGGDKIGVTLTLKSDGKSSYKDVIYYDSNKNFTSVDGEGTYKISSPTIGTLERKIKEKIDSEFDYIFDGFNIGKGETVTIEYNLTMPPVSFGKFSVGKFDSIDIGNDVALSPTNQCGADQLIWASLGDRDFKKGLQTYKDNTKLPEELEKNTIDANGNGVPDYIDELSDSAKGLSTDGSKYPSSSNKSKIEQYADEQISKYNKDSNSNGIPDNGDEPGGSIFEYDSDSGEINLGGLSAANLEAIDSGIDSLVNGLGCGFGGGACITFPLNWALMAPGSSLTLFGLPITPGIGLVGASSSAAPIPIFSAPTACIVPVWPPCPPLAGGTFDPPWGAGVSQFRLFITPTITGAVGIDMCMGPNVASYAFAPGLSPLMPGGQCVTASMPLLGCSDDGSDGDVSSLGPVNSNKNGNNTSSSSNSFINANACIKPTDTSGQGDSSPTGLSDATTSQIIRYLQGDTSVTKEILQDAGVQHGGIDPESGPLIGFSNSWGDSGDTLDVDIDMNALANLDVGNIMKVNFKRVSSFPDFIMDWVTNQLEEIVNKLTTLPTLYIILPDLSGLADFSFSNFSKNYEKALKKIQEKDKEDAKKNKAEADKAKSDLKAKKMNSQSLKDAQSYINDQKASIKNLTAKGKSGLDGMRAAMDVISNLPLISIQNENIDVNIPWIGPEDIDNWITKAKGKIEQYKAEIDDKKDKWSKFLADPVHAKILVDADNLINGIEKNIKILEEYKKFPEKLRKLVNWKEHFLQQILCNLEIINKVIGGWIYENGKRFKAWVNLIVLIKAILKSWQLLIDIFIDFNANCSVCHNERYNLLYWLIKLISALIPSIPIIQFPKWPDIIIDLHNIRAGINIKMPDFNFKVVPIGLPELPDLKLPDAPDINIGLNISLPEIPVLPSLPELPDLPDIPSLPEIKLPDLPPPPKVPDLLSAIKGVLQILKLVAKVLCLWRKIGNLLPPEWRSGDAIAWATERNGTLPFDKLFIDLPNLSIPFVDAIKVTSYVNLEFEVDFIVEMAKSVLEPFNSFSNDLTNMGSFLNQKIGAIDLSGAVPSSIDIKADVKVGKPESFNNGDKEIMTKYIASLAFFTISSIMTLTKTIKENSNQVVTVDIFKDLLKKDIDSLAGSTNPKEREIYKTLDRAINNDTSEEDKYLAELIKAKDEKFGVLKEIVSNEIEKNRSLSKELSDVEKGLKTVKDLSPLMKFNNSNIKISSLQKVDKEKELKSKLENNQMSFVSGVNAISESDKDKELLNIKKDGEEIVDKVKKGMEIFKSEVKEGKKLELGSYDEDKITVKNFATTSTGTTTQSSTTTNPYSYSYEGIYVINSSGKQTRLFNYLDEVDKETNIVELDYDGDGDQDVLYKLGDSLYLKDNLRNKPSIKHISGVSSMMDVSDIDDFLNIDDFGGKMPFAPNFFEEVVSASNSINFRFLPSDYENQTAFRIEFHDYLDRFDKTNNQKIFNKGMLPYSKIQYADMITNQEYENIVKSDDIYTIKNNFASIGGGLGNAYVRLPSYKVISKGDSLSLQEGKTIYSGEDGLTIKYKFSEEDDYQILSLDKRQNLTMNETASVTILNGSAILFYPSNIDFKGDIKELIGFPVLNGMKIELENKNSFANIEYIQGNMLTIDNGSNYQMYNLGDKNESYNVNLSIDNSYYYTKLYDFTKKSKSTISNMTLMSPQFEADNDPPLITVDNSIRVPVYISKTINLKKYIEDISGISEVYVDFDLDKDTDGDGIKDNDKDSLNPNNPFNIFKGSTPYDLKVGPYDKLFKKKILIGVKDNNGNLATAYVDFEVYAPIPEITEIKQQEVKGQIDEQTKGEIIDVFRYRNGIVERMDKLSDLLTKDKGDFSGIADAGEKGLVVKDSTGKEVARINETTGKIDIKDSSYKVNFKGASSENRMYLEIINKDKGNVVYKQEFIFPENRTIQEVTNFENVGIGIYFKPESNNFFLVKNSSTTTYLGNGAFIKDNTTNKAITGIGIDGNIYEIDKTYTYKYSNYKDYILLELVSNTGAKVGEILIKADSEFNIK